jgi:hypothetical protein
MLPPDIVSWLTCLLLSQPEKEPWSKEQMTSNFMRGITSNTTYIQSGSDLTHTLMNSPATKKLRFSAPALKSIREGRFGPKNHHKPIKSESVRATFDCVAQAFKLADRAEPRLDREHKLALLLQRQLRGYSSTDNPPQPQPTLMASILQKFFKLAISPMDKALCELFI